MVRRNFRRIQDIPFDQRNVAISPLGQAEDDSGGRLSLKGWEYAHLHRLGEVAFIVELFPFQRPTVDSLSDICILDFGFAIGTSARSSCGKVYVIQWQRALGRVHRTGTSSNGKSHKTLNILTRGPVRKLARLFNAGGNRVHWRTGHCSIRGSSRWRYAAGLTS